LAFIDPVWWDAALVIALIGGLASGRYPPAACFMAFIVGVVLTGRMAFSDALRLAVEPATIAVLSLVVFSAALSRIGWLRRAMFSRQKHSLRMTLLRFLGVAGLFSTVAPNTAVVGALMGPATRHTFHPAHHLLLPLSYVALAGGMMTPIGTSANIMVVGEAAKQGVALNLFHFAPAGGAALIAVAAALVIFAPFVLRRKAKEDGPGAELFHVEASVPDGSAMAGRTVLENNLRHLPNFYLAEIVRDGRVIAPVEPDDVLLEGDTLIFVGDVRRIEDLRALTGLALAQGRAVDQMLYQAVIAADSILEGATLREVGFRARFDASVLAIRRGNERLSGKLGQIRLRAGDLLFLAAGPEFHLRENVGPSFHIIDTPETVHTDLSRRRTRHVTFAFGCFLAAVLTGFVSVASAAFFLAVGAIALKWVTTREVRRNFPFDLAIALWGSVMLGTIIQRSGFDEWAASHIVDLVGGGDAVFALVAVFALTWVLTELLSNVSAALAALPVALDVAHKLDAPLEVFALAAAFGASASFLVPFGYQTHLMVLTPGGYRFRDFIVLGAIVLVVFAASSLSTLWWIWLR
jgi:di/tricarboxylate transporter